MAISLPDTRQYPLVALVTAAQGSLPDGVPTSVIAVPAGSIVTGGHLIVDTAFDSSTDDTLDVGFTTPNDTDDPDAYLDGSSDNGSSTGRIALVPTGREAAIDEHITIENTVTGTEGTAGVCRLIVEYIVDGRATENYE